MQPPTWVRRTFSLVIFWRCIRLENQAGWETTFTRNAGTVTRDFAFGPDSFITNLKNFLRFSILRTFSRARQGEASSTLVTLAQSTAPTYNRAKHLNNTHRKQLSSPSRHALDPGATQP